MSTYRENLCLATAIACLTLSAAPLTGCASSAPQTVALQPPPILECKPDPEPPVRPAPGAAAEDLERYTLAVAEYQVRLWDAGDDCRQTVRALRDWARSLPGGEDEN